SSRSRALKENMDTGMSQSGIYEAFAEADRWEAKKTVKKQLDTRRKSTSTVETKKSVASPRLTTMNTKKSNEALAKKPSQLIQSRRQTLSGALTSTTPKKMSHTGSSNSGGLVKLADTLRDTLAVERRLAQQELALLNEKKSTKTSQKSEQQVVVDMISNAKRRSSMTKEKLRSLEQPTRRRTLSSAASPRRKKSQKGAESPSFTSEDEVSPVTTTAVSALKRRSILAAATAKALGADETVTTNGGDEKHKTTTTLLRKKSLASEPDLLSRRMSRTESLKEGVPTSPSMMAARMSRRKSVVKQESPVNPAPNSRKSRENGNTTGDEQPAKKNVVRKRGKTLPGNLAKPPTVQSLQLPPMKIEPIKLNMPKTNTTVKRAPKSPSIKATLSSNRMTAKKRMSLSSANTTPIPNSSSSSSSTEVRPKKTNSSRKAKGQSHLGISTSRRASLKAPSSASVVTPPLKSSPVSASPRVRPRSTRRQSLGVLENKTHKEEIEQPVNARKLSSAYSNSRKNSLVDEAMMDKDKGRHRAISLREKLEAMVAQHAIHDEDTKLLRSPGVYPANTTTGMTATEYLAHRAARKSQTYDIDEKYGQLLSPEERARPQRIKETLMMWDKEMVEAFSPGVPKSPLIAIKFYGHHLSPFEQTEIQAYPEVYFVGQHAKKYQAMPDNPALNYGYDDERGDYKSVMNDHLVYRYEIMEELGRGSFGQVVKCYDHKTASTVAVKLIRNKKRFYAQAKTEVKILSDLSKWDPEDRHHNVKMTDSFYFRNHLCIAFECLSMNLYEFIKVNNFQGFHITLIKRFTIQLLRSLSLLARHGVVHCDLKPENILLKHPTKSTIKVIDFGS
ncbi:hypothetical protein CU098_000669, partial [Rhizopus stolonifer]